MVRHRPTLSRERTVRGPSNDVTVEQTPLQARARETLRSTGKLFAHIGWALRKDLKTDRDFVQAWLDDPEVAREGVVFGVIERLERFHRSVTAMRGAKRS